MRLVLIDRRREMLHVGLSLCEGHAPRGIQRNAYEQDEKNETSKCPDDHSQQPRFLCERKDDTSSDERPPEDGLGVSLGYACDHRRCGDEVDEAHRVVYWHPFILADVSFAPCQESSFRSRKDLHHRFA